MKLTSTRQIYFQPVVFKTISFHHQSTYFLEFQVKYSQDGFENDEHTAYSSVLPNEDISSFNRKNLVSFQKTNYIQTEKFQVLFNDQSVYFNNGCCFKIQTDRVRDKVPTKPKKKEKKQKIDSKVGKNQIPPPIIDKDQFKDQHIQCKLVISVYKASEGLPDQASETDPVIRPSQIYENSPHDAIFLKPEKVGEHTVFVNFDNQSDYSKFSNYRHMVFTKDQYFCAFSFYMDFVHLGHNIRLSTIKYPSLRQMKTFSKSTQKQKLGQMKELFRQNYREDTLRDLMGFKLIEKFVDLMIGRRLAQYQRVVGIYNEAVGFDMGHKKQDYNQLEEVVQEDPETKKRNILRCADNVTDWFNCFQKSLPLSNEVLSYLLNHIGQKISYFEEVYMTEDIDVIYNSIFEESKLIDRNIHQVWQKIMKIKLQILPQEFSYRALQYKIHRMNYISDYYSQFDENTSITQADFEQRIKTHKKNRLKVCQKSKFYDDNELRHSMLTYHNLKRDSVLSNSSQKDQVQILVVLVHGFKGSERDMAKIKSFINTFTSINFLPLKALNSYNNEDIESLGEKGAEEVQGFLKTHPYISSINMIGFSLGGVIAKSIVKRLHQHREKFNLFLTLASPHLGITELSNCLVSTGVGWMKNISGVKSIKELCHEPLGKRSGKIPPKKRKCSEETRHDHEHNYNHGHRTHKRNDSNESATKNIDSSKEHLHKRDQQIIRKVPSKDQLKKTSIDILKSEQDRLTLLRMSREKTLQWFRQVVLIGSNQDTYVPKYSSLMIYDGSSEIVKRTQEYTLKSINSLDRITVWFQYEESWFEYLTGSKGHISFLEDDTFLEFIILKYLSFF